MCSRLIFRHISTKADKAEQLALCVKAKELGAKAKLIGCANLPFIENVGIAEKRLQFDNRSIVTLYPSTHFSRSPKIMRNWKPADEDDTDNHPFKKYHLIKKHHSQYLKARPSVTLEDLKNIEYYYEDGLRKVKPYFTVMEAVIKQTNYPLAMFDYLLNYVVPKIDHHKTNLRLKMNDYYINGRPAMSDDLVHPNDVIANVVHKHENATLDDDVEIIYENEDILVVNKPATVSIYPIGNSRFNTLLYILAKEKGYMNLRNTHRIDKNTSGVCILGKGSDGGKRIHKIFKKHQSSIKKQYLAKVEGKFPPEEIISNEPLVTNHYSNTTLKEKVPMPASTKFQRLEYDPETDTSLVKCIPLTGRTHQIRRHLKMLGNPIINDYLYNDIDVNRRVFHDPDLMQSVCDRILERHFSKSNENEMELKPFDPNLDNLEWMESLKNNFKKEKNSCIHCELGPEYMRSYDKKNVLPMCLHSSSYEIDGKTFEASLPKWISSEDYYKDEILKPRRL